MSAFGATSSFDGIIQQEVNFIGAHIIGDMSNFIPLTSFYDDVNSNEVLFLGDMSSFILSTSCFQETNFNGAFIMGICPVSIFFSLTQPISQKSLQRCKIAPSIVLHMV